MKKVLFLIGSLGGGGAEKILIDTVNNLNKEKYAITVQTIFDEGVHKSELATHVRYKTIIKEKHGIMRKIIYYLVMHVISAKWIYKHFVEDDYDVEVAFLEGLPTKIIGQIGENVRKLAWVHINMLNNFNSLTVFKGIEEYKETYRCFDRIICVSEIAKRGFEARFGTDFHVEVLYNVLDEDIVKRKAGEKNLNINRKGIEMVTVGRLVDQKGYDRLVHIVKKLADEGFVFHITIVGEGKERSKLQEYIDTNQIEQYVTLAGYINNPYSIVNNSDVFICSSREEGFSTAVTEALILGVPVITTRCAGMDEILGGEECGIIVENSEEALCSALYDILTTPEKLQKYIQGAKERSAFFTKNRRIEAIENELDGGMKE